jgi:hypothetical protein
VAVVIGAVSKARSLAPTMAATPRFVQFGSTSRDPQPKIVERKLASRLGNISTPIFYGSHGSALGARSTAVTQSNVVFYPAVHQQMRFNMFNRTM